MDRSMLRNCLRYDYREMDLNWKNMKEHVWSNHVQACQVILKCFCALGHQDNKTGTKSYSVNRFPASTCYFKVALGMLQFAINFFSCYKLVYTQASLYVVSTLCNPPTPLQGAHQDSSDLQVQARVPRRRFQSTSKQGLGLALSWLFIKSVSFCVSSLPASSPFSTWELLANTRCASRRCTRGTIQMHHRRLGCEWRIMRWKRKPNLYHINLSLRGYGGWCLFASIELVSILSLESLSADMLV